jgi:hypothetical protein
MKRVVQPLAAIQQTAPRPAWVDVVLVVRAPNDGSTILKWQKRLKKHGLVLEEILTPEAWDRRCSKSEKK